MSAYACLHKEVSIFTQERLHLLIGLCWYTQMLSIPVSTVLPGEKWRKCGQVIKYWVQDQELASIVPKEITENSFSA